MIKLYLHYLEMFVTPEHFCDLDFISSFIRNQPNVVTYDNIIHSLINLWVSVKQTFKHITQVILTDTHIKYASYLENSQEKWISYI